MELDDKQLVARSLEGDARAFEALVRAYQRRVFRVAFGMLKNQEDAMDIAQEAFVKAHQNLDRFKGDAAFYTWIYRITTNLCIDHLRRKRGEHVEYDDGIRRQEAEGATLGLRTASKQGSPQKRALDHELAEQLEAALATLTDAHREILVLREVEGLSYEELAEALQIPKGTVMSRLFHARKKMQQALSAYVAGEPTEGSQPQEETG